MPLHSATRLYGFGCLCAAAIFLVLLCVPSPALGADRAGDEFLSGYIAATLERDLGWPSDSYDLAVVGGVATLTLFTADPLRREAGQP
ncbi:MAG: hypothetical protein EHM48_07590 [Planctomycetaceae bacterium]|nr:MAG: hypothetical protein EHM48_07590 [Planctomycetaceae bacterium]